MPGCRLDSAWVAALPKRDLGLIPGWVWASCLGFGGGFFVCFFCFVCFFIFFFVNKTKGHTGLHWEYWCVLRSWWVWEAWMMWHTRDTWREVDLFDLKMKTKGIILTGACKTLKGSYEDDGADLLLIAANNTARGSGHKLQLERQILSAMKHCSCGEGWWSRRDCPRESCPWRLPCLS